MNDVDFSKFEVQLYVAISYKFLFRLFGMKSDPHSNPLHRHNGAALDPPYTPPRFTGTEPTVEIKGAKIYTGGCHCGAVTLAFKSKPLPKVSQSESGVLSCDCSICTRVCTLISYEPYLITKPCIIATLTTPRTAQSTPTQRSHKSPSPVRRTSPPISSETSTAHTSSARLAA